MGAEQNMSFLSLLFSARPLEHFLPLGSMLIKMVLFVFRSQDISPDTASPRESLHLGAFKSFLKHQWGKPRPGIAVPGPPWPPAER